MRLPFEGDRILAEVLRHIVEANHINIVIETGTESGASAEAFASMVPLVCTSDIEIKLDRDLPPNVHMYVGDSADCLQFLLPDLISLGECGSIPHPIPLFFLDAHVAPHCTRVLDELKIIAAYPFTGTIIAIHDFQVPDHPELGFDTYDGLGPLCVDLVAPLMDQVFPSGWEVFFNRDADGAKRGVAIFYAS